MLHGICDCVGQRHGSALGPLKREGCVSHCGAGLSAKSIIVSPLSRSNESMYLFPQKLCRAHKSRAPYRLIRYQRKESKRLQRFDETQLVAKVLPDLQTLFVKSSGLVVETLPCGDDPQVAE